MDFLLDPNVAYLVLLAGILLSLLALAAPGTGLLEISALFALVLAGYAIYHLNFNFWALLVFLLGAVPFVVALRYPKLQYLLGLTMVALTVGSLFLFPEQNGHLAVNPVLAILASALFTAFAWVAVRKSIEAARERPVHDLQGLIGQEGEARTSVRNEGSVQVNGELWSARSDHPIPAGSHVRVVGREGFVLVVEKDQSSSKA